MLDLKFIRENSDLVRKNIEKKFQHDKFKFLDELLEKDKKYREILYAVEQLRKRRNSLSKEISEKKKTGQDADKLLLEAKKLPEELSKKEEELSKLKEHITFLQLKIPNIIADDVPLGKSDKDNVVKRVIGRPPKFTFDVKGHVEIGESLGIADFDGASRISGRGFFFLKGDLARLNQALIRFTIDFMIEKGYTLVEPPLMLSEESIHTVMPFSDFQEHAYKMDGKDQYLIATSEHPLVAWFKDQVIEKPRLPIKLVGYSQCFRQEIGSHGIDEKGLFRTHQFNKVEQVIICEPEDSEKYYAEILRNSVELYQLIGIPIRIIECCSGDLSDMKYKSEDVEAYSPRKKDYFEVGSCSNLTTAQARRANIVVFDGRERYTPHTLNNTAIATSRCMVAILENFQNADGSVSIPDVLQRYMGGLRKITPPIE
ncbi:serine--tRNA ligase [Candidatus Woesearchaeota archaeon]|nr:serine--tRNA ligase [Candidatus Woesearchaeota archaeon]